MVKSNLGLIHAYTGDGKGKTTAAMGLALRAAGQGSKVFILQFMKGGAYTGEFIAIKNFMKNIDFKQYGRPCIKENKQAKLTGFDHETGYKYFDFIREDIQCGECRWCFLNDNQQKEFVQEALSHAKEVVASGEYDLIVLDEILAAVTYNVLDEQSVLDLLELKAEHTELILTGRGGTEDIFEKCDLVTEMKQHKHYFDKGIGARRAIEY